MAEIINLNKTRKAKHRSEKEVRAAQNRQKHGRTKHEKGMEKLNAEKLDRHLDAHKRETPDD